MISFKGIVFSVVFDESVTLALPCHLISHEIHFNYLPELVEMLLELGLGGIRRETLHEHLLLISNLSFPRIYLVCESETLLTVGVRGSLQGSIMTADTSSIFESNFDWVISVHLWEASLLARLARPRGSLPRMSTYINKELKDTSNVSGRHFFDRGTILDCEIVLFTL